jgi:hypothetical protein
MLHKEYYLKGSVENKTGCDPEGAWRLDELIGNKPAVVKYR